MSKNDCTILRDIIVERLSGSKTHEETDVFEGVLAIYSRVDMDLSVIAFDAAIDSLLVDGLVSRPTSKWEGIELLKLRPRKKPNVANRQRLLAGWARACHHKSPERS